MGSARGGTRAPARIADDGPYAPRGLVLDAAALGLVRTEVASALGSCVAHHRRERASDTAIVFLHGAAGAWTTWTPLLAEAAGSTAPLHDAVLLDLPGWGDARITRDRDDVTAPAIASLVDAILSELGYTRWHLIGHSLGGFVALHLAATRPDRVVAVGMLSGTTWSVISSVAHPVRRFGELPAFTMLWRLMRLLAALGRPGEVLVRAAAAVGLMRLVFAPLFAHGWRVPRTLVRATVHDLRPAAFAAAAEVTRGYDADAIWSRISCPVHAAKGDRDVFVTRRDLERLGRVVPHSVRSVIADCGHFAAVERPAAALRALGLAG